MGNELRVGLLGLGRMGFGLASSALRAGLPLTVVDVRPEPVDELVALGARPARSPAALAAESDVVAVCVVTEEQVLEVVAGADGILDGAAPGTTVILHSTIVPETCREVEQLARRRDVDVLDVGISGYPEKAATGDLTLMIGGDAAVVERCRPYLGAIGTKSFHVGPVGSGEVAKIANNVMAIFGIHGTYQGLELARAYGIDPELMAEVASAATGNNDALRRWRAGYRTSSTTNPASNVILKRALEIAQSCGAELAMVSALIEGSRQFEAPPHRSVSVASSTDPASAADRSASDVERSE